MKFRPVQFGQRRNLAHFFETVKFYILYQNVMEIPDFLKQAILTFPRPKSATRIQNYTAKKGGYFRRIRLADFDDNYQDRYGRH